MPGSWTAVLPYALACAGVVALVRSRHLRTENPGLAPGQRLGLFLSTAPLFVLLLVGMTSLPRLLTGSEPMAVPSEVLAGKAVLHFLLYLAVPLTGLFLVAGPRHALARLPRALFGDRDALEGLARGLARATVLLVVLVPGVLLGWSALSSQAGLLSAEGPRVFFSNTTPGVALALAGVAAVAEEVLFRGVLLSGLKRRLSLHPAVAIQALLFGLIHAGYGSLLHVAAATTFGLIMGYLVQRDGLLPAMSVHFVVNVAVLAAWSGQGALLGAAVTLVAAMAIAAWLLRDVASAGAEAETGGVRATSA